MLKRMREMAHYAPLQDVVVGYPMLAAKMELQPEVSLYRRFGGLNARNLLYLQAEIAILEKDLYEFEVEDNKDNLGEKRYYAESWFWLSQSQNDGDTKQLNTVLKLRELLSQYSVKVRSDQALIHQSTLLKLQEPDEWDLSDIQKFLASSKMRVHDRLALIGNDSGFWGSILDPKSYAPDLVALKPRQRQDLFSEWISRNALAILLRCGCKRWMKSSRHGLIGYQDRTILKITYGITNILASLIPVASMALLYTVRHITVKLSIIAAFNVLLSICLGGLTNAKRSEIFAVTAAFAAVQVVFIGLDRNGAAH
ncbi:hypothetical protein CC78DRAFT_546846 [Lojkania enalia]|uniref:DUF6594 domain-containing protein n=1 Tax=Lojkania enalia TaxID=147567 RepID=A0A9P4K6X1_9PLEO|nr:hypothetical protein CC78DRAFT_546846 [Didymosphaeria enalia]